MCKNIFRKEVISIFNKPPCYDTKTNTDCVDRRPGCGATCRKWQAYMKKRNKEYIRRKAANDLNQGLDECRYKAFYKRLKRKEKFRNIHRT